MTDADATSHLEYSSLDSDRFGLSVFRARRSSLDHALALAIVEHECDVAIVRIAVGDRTSSEFQRFGFDVRHADTLVYYDCDPALVESKPHRNGDVVIRSAASADTRSLEKLVERVFAEYPSHYSANELFAPGRVLAGYVQWATDFIERPCRNVLLAQLAGQTIGFLTYEKSETCVEIVLNGVDPDWQGRGIYGDLMRTVLEKARRSGVPKVVISTQVNNYKVQSVWSREGFRLSAAYDTFHINSMLTTGQEIATLTIPPLNGADDVNVQSVLSAFEGQMPALTSQLSRLEVVSLVSAPTAGECQAVIRSHETSWGVTRCVGAIRDSSAKTVGIIHADLQKSTRKEMQE